VVRTEYKNWDTPELCQSSRAQVGLVLGGRARCAGPGVRASALAASDPALGMLRHAGGTSHPNLKKTGQEETYFLLLCIFNSSFHSSACPKSQADGATQPVSSSKDDPRGLPAESVHFKG